MTCERVVFPDGTAGWMCGDPVEDVVPSCSECGGAGAEYLCDGPAPEGSGRVTCDAPLCGRCTAQTDPLLTLPTDSALRVVLRLAAGNVSGPGLPLTAPERAHWRALLADVNPARAEPHDYCRRCSDRLSRVSREGR